MANNYGEYLIEVSSMKFRGYRKNINRGVSLFFCLSALGLFLHCESRNKQTGFSQPPPKSVAQTPSVSQNTFVCPQVKKLVFQLIWKQKFSRIKANDESIFFMPPDFPKDFLQRIVVSSDAIIFFDDNGIFIKSIPVKKGSHITFSNNTNYIAINTPEDFPKSIPPDYHRKSKAAILNASGDIIYSFNSLEDNTVLVSDLGAAINISMIDPEVRIYDATGNLKKLLKPTLSSYDFGNKMEARYSATDSFALFSNDNYWPHKQGEAIIPTCFISMYDANGNMIWMKQAPTGYVCEHGIGTSDIGDRVLVMIRQKEGPNNAILYDGNGEIIKNIPSPIGVNLDRTILYNSVKGVFVLKSVKNIFLVDRWGNVSIVDPTFELVDTASSKYVVTVGTKSPGNNIILRIFDLCGNLLLEENIGGNKNDLTQTGVRISNDGSIVSIKFSNEIRYYRIREL